MLTDDGVQQALDDEDLSGDITPFAEYFEDFCADNADDDDSVSSSSTSVSEGEESDSETFVSEGAEAPRPDPIPASRLCSGRNYEPLSNVMAAHKAALVPPLTQRSIKKPSVPLHAHKR